MINRNCRLNFLSTDMALVYKAAAVFSMVCLRKGGFLHRMIDKQEIFCK